MENIRDNSKSVFIFNTPPFFDDVSLSLHILFVNRIFVFLEGAFLDISIQLIGSILLDNQSF